MAPIALSVVASPGCVVLMKLKVVDVAISMVFTQGMGQRWKDEIWNG
jgi:hypothetical protein